MSISSYPPVRISKNLCLCAQLSKRQRDSACRVQVILSCRRRNPVQRMNQLLLHRYGQLCPSSPTKRQRFVWTPVAVPQQILSGICTYIKITWIYVRNLWNLVKTCLSFTKSLRRTIVERLHGNAMINNGHTSAYQDAPV